MNKVSFARKLRRNQTDAERLLWLRLCRKNINDIKFRRQQPIRKYIVDFVGFDKKLIIELDGSQHSTNENMLYDQQRTMFFENQGYTMLRFWDNEVLQNLDEVLEKIFFTLTQPLPSRERSL